MAAHSEGKRIGRRATVGLVVAAMAGLFWFAPKRRPARPPADPVDCVTAMIEAARAGDVAGYIECLSGSARREAESQIAAGGVDRFSEYLKAGLVGLNGLAFHDQERLTADHVRMTVERVFADYNERQPLELCRAGEGWTIDQVGPAERYAPLIRYGTPVSAPATAAGSEP